MSVTPKNPICKVSLKILGDYWTMLIIDILSDGPCRFRDLEEKIEGVNTATLSTRLKSMQQAGIISRDEQSRADVTYALTELGKRAVPILNAVNDYANFAKKQHIGQ
jgi:DNA-binding HxlR family transcriptional regulator